MPTMVVSNCSLVHTIEGRYWWQPTVCHTEPQLCSVWGLCGLGVLSSVCGACSACTSCGAEPVVHRGCRECRALHRIIVWMTAGVWSSSPPVLQSSSPQVLKSTYDASLTGIKYSHYSLQTATVVASCS